VSQGVQDKYERELERLNNFMVARSKFFPADMKLDDLVEFRATWNLLYPSSLTRQKVQERLRGFLRYCHESGHIEQPLKLKPIRSVSPPTMPLTDAEYDHLLGAIPKTFEKKPQTIVRVRALIRLMRHSGLGIRDAVTIERSRIQLDEANKCYQIVTKRQKSGVHVRVPIPKDVGDEVLAVANGNPRYVFWSGTSKPTSAVTNYQHDLRTLFHGSGFPKGHPHQLRDTFARALLEKGLSLENVSKLLGHTSIKTTEKHYAQWVIERQRRLTADVISTWGK
ncbi:MAG: tyrosine-type recombinase/integrase, partial [Candidatus Acidiferrales bacterium]